MASLRDIKRRIRSIQNTKQVTRAMKMVASANLGRAQERAESSRPYAEKMREVIGELARDAQDVSHPMLEFRPVKKSGYLIITSDRGLAGGYNGNLLRKLVQTLNERHQSKDEYVLLVIGKKGSAFLRQREYPVIDEVTGLPDFPEFADIRSIAKKAVGFYAEEKYDELYLVYNEFVNPAVQRPLEKRLLPLGEITKNKGPSAGYEYEPSPEGVLEEILPRYAETLIYSALLEAKASEFGARMVAMDNATENAEELIGELTLLYNRARQAAITQEIAEIVGAANALE
mgnify:CR=1 FL=1